MNVFVNSSSCVAPAVSVDNIYAGKLPDLSQGKLYCGEVDYRNYIDAPSLRRMNRIVKIGVSASRMSLSSAGLDLPGAIILGTGMGCLENTEKFINDLVKNNERLLNPACFINSTHNTISSQVAINLKCRGYNMTYSHRIFSFESALQDAMLYLRENAGSSVLAGGVDELTGDFYHINGRLGKWRNVEAAGEGCAMFCVSDTPSSGAQARIYFVETLHKELGAEGVGRELGRMLDEEQIKKEDIDLLLCGINGDAGQDAVYSGLHENYFTGAVLGHFKHLCGEYRTASAYALWLAVQILGRGTVPESVMVKKSVRNSLRKILIYNHYGGKNHAFILLGSA